MTLVDTNQGVLVVVMNYTADVLDFGVAVKKARAASCTSKWSSLGMMLALAAQRLVK